MQACRLYRSNTRCLFQLVNFAMEILSKEASCNAI